MRPDIRYLEEKYDFGKSVVLVRGNRHPDYASAAIYNPVDLNADAPIYVWDRSAQVRKQILQFYSDRPVWIVNDPSITKTAYDVVKGPISTDSLLQETIIE